MLSGIAKAHKKAAFPRGGFFMSFSTLKKVKREGGGQRRPAQSERKNRVFSAKRQAVWFETRSVSN
ncbi:hypothetical protein QUW15_00095 [Desulfovibrio piger]|nr:hypothetical protein [Desulfovibrio piger]